MQHAECDVHEESKKDFAHAAMGKERHGTGAGKRRWFVKTLSFHRIGMTRVPRRQDVIVGNLLVKKVM